VTSDVTIRKKAEEKLNASESRFRSLIENSADMISMMDETGRFIYVSPAVTKKFDFSYDECLALNAMEIIHPEDVQIAQEFFSEVLIKPAEPLAGPAIRNRRKDGSYLWVEGTITNLLNMEGVGAIVCNFRDITERKKVEDALLEANENFKISNERLNEAQQIAHLGSWMWDVKKNVKIRSAEFYKIFGLLQSEFPYDTDEIIQKVFHPDDCQIVNNAFKQSLIDHKPFQCEARITMSNGNVKTIFLQGQVVEDKYREVEKMFGTVQDITERKKSWKN